jgi:hypothetical protein
MRFKMMVLAAAVSVTLPAVAQTADPAAPSPKKEKKVCRRLDQTGSILGSRPTCHTKDEWASIDATNSRNADKTMDDSRRVGGSRADGSF